VNRLETITAAGQSIWFDDLRRDLLSSGELKRLVAESSVTGVTTNPTILAKAISESDGYDDQLTTLFRHGAGVADAYRELVTEDIRGACDVLAAAWERSGRRDGFVSVEVSPGVADDAAATIEEVREWVETVGRRNLLVKVPATDAGAEAFEELTAQGTSVNVTLIFSLSRYRDIAGRYIRGLERLVVAGGDPSGVHSVASFFVSRVDTEVDSRLDALASQPSRVLRGKAGIANARVAYGIFRELFDTPGWRRLASAGAHVQRPLWASTGVKDPAYRDTMYVDELVAPDTVNTMPLATLRAVADHGVPRSGITAADISDARGTLDRLAAVGIDYADLITTIEREGLEKFAASFDEITALLSTKREQIAV
jgi:transaldolase